MSGNLDEEELLHLAIDASRNNRHGDAIAYLKQAISASKGNYRAIYLLAAEYAQIGMMDRATEGFREAIAIKPDLASAHFQLGLSQVARGQLAAASESWAALEKLDAATFYVHFKRGLEALIRNDVASCEEEFVRGFKANQSNPALNADMQRVLDAAKAQEARLSGEQRNGAVSDVLSSRYVDVAKNAR